MKKYSRLSSAAVMISTLRVKDLYDADSNRNTLIRLQMQSLTRVHAICTLMAHSQRHISIPLFYFIPTLLKQASHSIADSVWRS